MIESSLVTVEKVTTGNVLLCTSRNRGTQSPSLIFNFSFPNISVLLYKCIYPCCFHRSIGHVVGRETQNLQVPYYVDKNFEKNYQGTELQELEKTIEKDYIDYIQTSCWKEKQQSKLFL